MDALNQSSLKNLRKAPKYFAYKNENNEQTKEMAFGSALHEYVLTPESFEKTYKIIPDTTRGTNKWRDYQEEFKGKELLVEKDFSRIKEMKNAIYHNNIASRLLNSSEKEVVYTWDENVILHSTGETEKIKCKAKVDIVVETNGRYDILADIKTTVSASPSEFANSMAKYSYHMQGAFYLEAYKQNTGRDATFLFIAIEKYEPYLLCLHQLSLNDQSIGICDYKNLLMRYLDCKKSDEWSADINDGKINATNLPAWYVYQYNSI
jgi:hypothetical protein